MTPSATTAAETRPDNIMVVDDNPTNLTLLEDMLRGHGYDVRLLPRGRMALAAANQEPPDLILLDINMPEMNGYEVCQRLKATEGVCDVPVIFLSALNAPEDKIRGFQAGGVDYISKPFHMEEVQARVQAQLALRRARLAERELLERTLGGASGVLWELVQLSSPTLALRSAAIRHITARIVRHLKITDAWKYDLAARLCLLGCVTVPEKIFEKAYAGQTITADEERIFRSHPDKAARLLSRIPRLEEVAEIIRGQNDPGIVPHSRKETRLGAEILNAAISLDRRLYLDVAPDTALGELKMTGKYDPTLLRALENYFPPRVDAEMRRLPIRDLRASMILRQDIFSDDGRMLILKEGTVLNDIWIERLENFSKSRSARESVEVMVPKIVPADALEAMG